MNDGNHNHDAASATPRLPARPGGVTMADIHYRKSALEHAARLHPHGPARSVVNSAAALEAYLRDGVPAAPPQPEGPLLPPDLVSVAIQAPADTLYAVQLVLAERARQIAKGYNAAHDDEHTSGEIADQAAAAILGGSRYLARGTFPMWTDPSASDTETLVQGIAFALSELERVHRANDRANSTAFVREARQYHAPLAAEMRTHGAESAVDDDNPEDATGRPGTVA